MRTSVNVDDVCELRKRQTGIVLLDVRQPDEYAQASIEGSMLVPINKLMEELPKLELPKDKEVICICRSGRTSALAADFLRQQGYQAANMEGGLRQWFIHQKAEGTVSESEFKRIMDFLGPH